MQLLLHLKLAVVCRWGRAIKTPLCRFLAVLMIGMSSAARCEGISWRPCHIAIDVP